MKILFVASGNKKYGVSSFVASQAQSLRKIGIDVVIYAVKGKGLIGYVTNIMSLRKAIKSENPDIIHAHYSTCGILASLTATHKPIFVSILGSFPNPHAMKLFRVRFFIKYIWNDVLVKSQRTADQLGIKNLNIVPNGVDMDQFKPIDYDISRKQLGFEQTKKYVIFVSNPNRIEKNFALAKATIDAMEAPNIVLLPIFDRPHDEIVKYMSAADALIMTSLSEGSPNVIKEAMACNCPLVATDVGDIRWLIEGVDGCYVSNTYNTLELKNLLEQAFAFKRTQGREKIIQLELDDKDVAKKILNIYKMVLNN